jgi:hypothetical protein
MAFPESYKAREREIDVCAIISCNGSCPIMEMREDHVKLEYLPLDVMSKGESLSKNWLLD